ncbi:MAG: ThiF family adenylyltransferase, partial [Clostridia bacterium]
MLIGNDGVERLKHARVLLCGVGGVGGYCLEALVRAGVGEIGILDNDTFSPSNLNRQILATVA